MQNIQTWTPVAFVLLQHRNKGTRLLFHPCIDLGFNCEQQKQFAEPDIINSELRSAFVDSFGDSGVAVTVTVTVAGLSESPTRPVPRRVCAGAARPGPSHWHAGPTP